MNVGSIEYDAAVTHYAPAGQSCWCGASRRAHERADGSLLRLKTRTDVAQVDCVACLICVREEARERLSRLGRTGRADR